MNLSDLLKDPSKAEKVLRRAINTGERKVAEMLIPIVKDPGLTIRYALEIVEDKIKDEWEDIIATDPTYSYRYASFVHAPFPKGEDAIATNAYSSYYYAYEVLKDPFPKGEDAIAKDPDYSYSYAKDIIKGPWPKGEPAIASHGVYSYYYANQVLKDRFPKGEKAIIESKDPEGDLVKYIDFLKTINKLDEFLKDHPEVKL